MTLTEVLIFWSLCVFACFGIPLMFIKIGDYLDIH